MWGDTSTSYDTSQTLAVSTSVDSGNDANFQIELVVFRLWFLC